MHRKTGWAREPSGGARQPDHEPCAHHAADLVDPVLRRDPAAQRLEDLPADRQAQPGMLAEMLACRPLGVEPVKDAVEPVGPRLFLPDEWTGDAVRAARAGVPEAAMTLRSKGEISLAKLNRLLAAGVWFTILLVDAGYGTSVAF